MDKVHKHTEAVAGRFGRYARWLVLSLGLAALTAFLAACSGGGGSSTTAGGGPGPGPDPTGSVTGTVIGCGSGVTGTCYSLNITCPGIAEMDGVTLRVKPPSGTPVGTIVLSVGGGGVGFYEDKGIFTFGANVVDGLISAGFTTVQISFTGTINGATQTEGWLTGPGGVRKLACRYASAAQWIYQNIHMANTGAPFCATGNSGGSAMIAYAMAHYGLGSIFAMVQPTSGPPMGRIDHGCICNQPPVSTFPTMCPSSPPTISECYVPAADSILNAAYGSPPGPPICTGSATDTTNATLFLNDSVASPDANLSYPKTAVHFIYGGMDTTAAVPQGLDWATIILTNHTIACAPTAPHAVADDLNGANQIVADLTQSCHLQ